MFMYMIYFHHFRPSTKCCCYFRLLFGRINQDILEEKIMEKADLITEMREIKHYYKKGVPAREGIEF